MSDLINRWPGALALVALGLLSGCPAADVPSCLDTICTPGAATCEGNYTAICGSEGKSIRYSDCGSGQFCQAQSGACATRKCFNLGGGSCLDSSTLQQCDDNGTLQTTVSCAGSEVCAGGACIPSACTDGAVRCGDLYTVLTCVGTAWTDTTCSGGDVCMKDAAGALACVPPVCAANTARCDGNSSLVCNFSGTAEASTACGSNEVCDAGWCRLKVCGESVGTGPDGMTTDTVQDTGAPDVAGADAKPEVFIPPLEPNSKLTFVLNGVTKDFDLSVRAEYVAVDKNLRIKGARNLEKIEINLFPIDPFVLGKFDDTDGSDVGVQICYFDGTNNDTVGQCSIGFSHASIGYTVDLTSNNGKGSRVKGTFSAILKDKNEVQTPLTMGEFDVKHF